MKNFRYLQKVFKIAIASFLLILNILGVGWAISIAKSAVICSALATLIPAVALQPLNINISWLLQGVANTLIMLIFGILKATLALFSVFWPAAGTMILDAPHLISIPALVIPTGITPVEIIPFFKDPANILALCDYTNITGGILLAVLITGAIASLLTFVLTKDIPKTIALWINNYRANRAMKLAAKLEKVVNSVEERELSNSDNRRGLIAGLKKFFFKNKLGD